MARFTSLAVLLVATCIDDFFGHDQAEECALLIACTEALVPGTGPSMMASYGPDGACWKTQEAVDACTLACTQAMTGISANPAFADTPACHAPPTPK